MESEMDGDWIHPVGPIRAQELWTYLNQLFTPPHPPPSYSSSSYSSSSMTQFQALMTACKPVLGDAWVTFDIGFLNVLLDLQYCIPFLVWPCRHPSMLSIYEWSAISPLWGGRQPQGLWGGPTLVPSLSLLFLLYFSCSISISLCFYHSCSVSISLVLHSAIFLLLSLFAYEYSFFIFILGR